jgi:hypothetical protein
MTLPGQTLINGVSNYIFGSHIGQDYATHTIRNTPEIQALAKNAGVTLLRCAIPKNNADAYIDQTAAAAAASGADMLVILDFSGGLSWCQHVVSYLGSRCKLYEFRNEPDLASISWQTYLADWNNVIPKLRQINPSAAFGGPALGVFDNRDSFLKNWLAGCVSSGVLPDFVSYHIYPCTGQGSASVCSTKSGNFKSNADTMNALVTSVVGHTIPLALTEWNIDANNPPQSYTQDASYVDPWYQAAIDSIVQGGYAIACQFSFGSGSANGKLDLVETTSPYNTRAGYATLKTKITQYLGTLTGGGGGTGNVSNPMSFYMADADAPTLGDIGSQLYTTDGANSTTWYYIKLGTATGWSELNSFTTTAAWSGAGSIGAQSGNGYILESTFLEGKQIGAGTITANIRLNCGINDSDTNHGSVKADIAVRLSKRSSGGVYTTIATLIASNQTIPSGFTTFALSGSLADPVSFTTGDKLYIDHWANVLTNTNGLSNLSIRVNRISTDDTEEAGDPNASVTVPNVTGATVGATTPLSLYEAAAASSVKATASQLYIATSASPTNVGRYSRIGTATGYGQVCSQTTTGAWSGSGTIGDPDGKGFFLDGTLLDNKFLVAGNWTPKVRLNSARNGDANPQSGTFTADIIVRAFKYTASSDSYTPIMTSTLTGQTLNNNFTTFTLPTVASDSIAFDPGQFLYIDIWLKVLSNGNGWSDLDVRLNRLSTDTGGQTGDANTEVVTPGYATTVSSGGGDGGGGDGGVTISAAQITSAALGLFRDQLARTIKYVAFGTGTADLTPNDTRLGAEYFRKAVSSTQQGTNAGEVLVSVFLAGSDAVGKDIREVGFFGGDTATSDANSGTLIARALFTTDDKTDVESFVFQLDLSYLLS